MRLQEQSRRENARPTLEYCAARYLDFWVRTEERLHTQFVGGRPSNDAVREALAVFKVSRGFPDIENVEQQRLVIQLLKRHGSRISTDNVANRVTDLAHAFQADFGQVNTSAASKLLWLRWRSPVVLLDTRAVRALRSFGHHMTGSDYGAFYAAWRHEFAVRERAVQRAAAALPRFAKFTAAAHLARSTLERVSAAPWFVERVFDQFLWQLGDPEAGMQLEAKN